MQNFTSATIISSPDGTLVSGSTNTYFYPILSSVNLTCDTVPSATSSTMFTWNVTGCTTCFPLNEMMQNVSASSLTPDDAGTFTCTADGGSTNATSDPFTLRVSCKLQQIASHALIDYNGIAHLATYTQRPQLSKLTLIKLLNSKTLYE